MSNKTIVIKIGTNTLFDENVLRDDVIESLAVSISDLRKDGINFAIVTSGAVQSGANELNLPERPKNLKEYSKSYINHLINSNEILASMILTMNNIVFYQDLMRKIREAIKNNTFDVFYKKYINVI